MCDVILEGDNCNNDLPFSGKTILLGGDFHQILPVILGGIKEADDQCFFNQLNFVVQVHCIDSYRKHASLYKWPNL